MTIRKLVNELVKREGLKKQVEISQVREIIGHLSDMMFEEDKGLADIYIALIKNGLRRAKKKGKVKS